MTQNADLEMTKQPKIGELFDSAKQHTKCLFSAKIAKLEKEFLPRKTAEQQSDSLYDKLKTYHDRLLNSVSNTTTQVRDVIKNPAVIDHCNRKFCWSDEDAGRLTELNKTRKLLQPRNDWSLGATDDSDAFDMLGPNLELAKVDSSLAEHTVEQAHEIEQEIKRADEGLTDATATSGLSENHIFSFDRYENLYMKPKDVLHIRKQGKLEIVKDPTVRKATYSASANLAFPYLYPHGEMSPLDLSDNKLACYLLKEQALYAHRMSNGSLQWTFAADDIHMAHQYSRLSEQTVRASIVYYLSSHPTVAHLVHFLTVVYIYYQNPKGPKMPPPSFHRVLCQPMVYILSVCWDI